MKPTKEDRFPADHKVDDKIAPEAEKQRYAAASGSGTEVEVRTQRIWSAAMTCVLYSLAKVGALEDSGHAFS